MQSDSLSGRGRGVELRRYNVPIERLSHSLQPIPACHWDLIASTNLTCGKRDRSGQAIPPAGDAGRSQQLVYPMDTKQLKTMLRGSLSHDQAFAPGISRADPSGRGFPDGRRSPHAPAETALRAPLLQTRLNKSAFGHGAQRVMKRTRPELTGRKNPSHQLRAPGGLASVPLHPCLLRDHHQLT